MWAVALFTDPKSKFKDLAEVEREVLIQKDFNKEFSVKTLATTIDKWRSFLSPAERQMIIWDRFMDQKNEYMLTLNYAEHGDEIEKRLKSNGSLFDEYIRLKDLIAEEESEGMVKGGAIESLSEKGEI